MSGKGKKAVSQEDLRRMMKEKQRERRIDSPLAKYTSSGRLVCAVCGEHVRSETLWQAHLLSRGHKERVKDLKEGQKGEGEEEKRRKEQAKEVLGKRKKGEEKDRQEVVEKKKKKDDEEEKMGGKGQSDAVPADFFQKKSAGAAGLSLLAGQYGDDDDDDEEEKGEDDVNKANKSQPSGDAGGLPADFFESAKIPSESVDEQKEENEEKPEPQLPEGFFDDPVKDARVRNVDTPREQMDREWEEFQKEMRFVNSASDAIVAEDDEEGRIERQIDEIDEQIECFRRVELLRAKQEAVQSRTAMQRKKEEREEDEEEDEEELLHVLSRDWRAKGALA
ncbi:zinc finger protein 830 [Hoplias malabaricus]|uniref:zinc finger protein 830 n=1 Tax=Hoplias malabaricus TaxID=27720 RepID=UPI0034632A5D